MRKIAVLRPNAVGDFVFALPALHALKKTYPGAELVLLGRPWHADFLAHRPGPVDRVVVVPPLPGIGLAPDADDGGAGRAFIAAMRAEGFDIACQMYGGGRHANPLVAAFGARLSVGARSEDATPLDRWVRHTEPGNRRLALLEIAALAGAPEYVLGQELWVTAQDRAAAAAALAEASSAVGRAPPWPGREERQRAPGPTVPAASVPQQPAPAPHEELVHSCAVLSYTLSSAVSPTLSPAVSPMPPPVPSPMPSLVPSPVPLPVPSPMVSPVLSSLAPPACGGATGSATPAQGPGHVRAHARAHGHPVVHPPAHPAAHAGRFAHAPVASAESASRSPPLVLLQPGATDPRRCWPPEYFAAVGDALAQAGAAIAVNGTAAESARVAAVIAAMRAPALDLSGKLDLGGLCGVIDRAACVVSNDTGPLHLALAIGKPCVGIFWLTNLIDGMPLRQGLLRAALSLRQACPVCGAVNLHRRCPHDASFVADVPVECVTRLALEALQSGREAGALTMR